VVAGFPGMFFISYLAKNYNIVDNSAITKAKGQNKDRFGILKILET